MDTGPGRSGDLIPDLLHHFTHQRDAIHPAVGLPTATDCRALVMERLAL
jgi:hypothetical protein